MERNFKVIKGGLDARTDGKKTFADAYVTDTRLMGVVALYIHWEVEDDDMVTDLHQFFYFDAEEYGFETYKSVLGNNIEEIELIESALIGGLGGQKIDVTEKEAKYLVQHYANMNHRLNIEMPGEQKEYQFILNEEVILSTTERRKLFEKMCDDIYCDYQVINYFLMRCFGHDFTAAKHLTDGRVPVEIYPEYPMATFCKNTIEECPDEKGTYMCESLIEFEGTYHLVVSEVTVFQLNVVEYKKHSGFKISSAEASLMLARPEFITVYDMMIEDPDTFEEGLALLTSKSLLTVHENGRMYLLFNEDNGHVANQEYRLNSDVYGMLYISDSGQMIIASYDIINILHLEANIRKNPIAESLGVLSKYEFKEPILYEFIHSGFEDFDEFIDLIKE